MKKHSHELVEALFNAACAEDLNFQTRCTLHDLAQARIVQGRGGDAADEYVKLYLRVLEDGQLHQAMPKLDAFLGDVKQSVRSHFVPPVFVLWNLNSMSGSVAAKSKQWEERAAAVKTVLAAKPKEATALVVHRKHEPRGHAGLNTQLAALFELSGINLDVDVALNFCSERSAMSDKSMVNTAWLAVAEGHDTQDHAFGKARRLLQGSITNLPATVTGDMVPVTDPTKKCGQV